MTESLREPRSRGRRQLLAAGMRLMPGVLLLLAADVHLHAETQPPVAELVRKMDQLRIPRSGFTAQLAVKRVPASGQPEEANEFRVFTRRREMEGGVQFDTLLVCDAPRRDAGKLVLLSEARCWLYDPRATHPTAIPIQQVGAQAAFAESLNWLFSRDCEARLLREETDANGRRCSVIEFLRRADAKLLPPRMIYWVDAAGRSWKAEHYASSGKVLRSIEFNRYAQALGAEHLVEMRLVSRGETHEVSFSSLKAEESPSAYFELRSLSKLKLPARP